MKITIKAIDIQPGDVLRGREVAAVKYPKIKGGMLTIVYEEGDPIRGFYEPFYPDDIMQVDRIVETIIFENEERIK